MIRDNGMIKKMLKMVIEKAIKEKDPFLETELFHEICSYVGIFKPTIRMTIYGYAKKSKRDYSTVKRIVQRYDLGTPVGRSIYLTDVEMGFLDTTKR